MNFQWFLQKMIIITRLLLIIKITNKGVINMNIKKIGLTALAGSLVATSAFAGSMSATGSASFEVQHNNGSAANAGKAWSMGNSVTFAGSGELDNGLNITASFELDQGAAAGTGPFDSHGLTIGNDTFGTLTFQGHGGAAAQTAIDDMASGDIWDNGFSATGAPTSSSTNNMLAYKLPEMVDGLSVNVSYVPHTAASSQYASTMDWAVAYTGVEGLTVGYGSGENKATKGSEADVSSYYVKYAYGPVTVAFHETEFDSEATTTTADIDFTAYSVAYTVTDEISVAYKVADLSTPNASGDADQEVSGVTASYTAGGMTISGKMINADNVANSTAVTSDQSMWELSASFAF
jgi:outer membrane protein OmpU